MTIYRWEVTGPGQRVDHGLVVAVESQSRDGQAAAEQRQEDGGRESRGGRFHFFFFNVKNKIRIT